MLPTIHLNALALAAATFAMVGVGFIWYGPLFGRVWLREIGIGEDAQPEPVLMLRGLLLMLAGSLLTAYAVACTIEVWHPSAWRLTGDRPQMFYGVLGALLPWLGFVVPMLLNGVAWERRSWTLFAINAGYQLAAFLTAAMILAWWR